MHFNYPPHNNDAVFEENAWDESQSDDSSKVNQNNIDAFNFSLFQCQTSATRNARKSVQADSDSEDRGNLLSEDQYEMHSSADEKCFGEIINYLLRRNDCPR